MSAYANQIRYEFNQHEVRLTFMDKQTQFEGVQGAEIGVRLEAVASVVMTRQSFRAFLEIQNAMAKLMPPIGIPDPADREQDIREE